MDSVSYTHLRAHETDSYLVCRLLLEKTNIESYESNQQLNETSKCQTEKIESLSHELLSYNKSFNNLFMVLLPDMRNVFNGDVEEMNKLTVNLSLIHI